MSCLVSGARLLEDFNIYLLSLLRRYFSLTQPPCPSSVEVCKKWWYTLKLLCNLRLFKEVVRKSLLFIVLCACIYCGKLSFTHAVHSLFKWLNSYPNAMTAVSEVSNENKLSLKQIILSLLALESS